MTNLSTLLEYLDEDIDEAAKSVPEAISEKLAAYTSNSFIILYNPQTAVNNNKKNKQNYVISFQNAIVGYVRFEPNDDCDNNTYEVKNSAALSGYGPLIYDLVLSQIYPNYLIADRNSISNKALKVWDFYLNNRPDVNKQLLSSIIDYNPDNSFCSLPAEAWNKSRSFSNIISNLSVIKRELQDAIDFNDDPKSIAKLQSQLDKTKQKAELALAKIPTAYKYQIKSPKGLTALKNNHLRFIQLVPSMFPNANLYKNFDPKQYVEQALLDEAETFFEDMY